MNHESETTADPGGEPAADNGERSPLDSPPERSASILRTRSGQVAIAAAVVALVVLVVVLVRSCGGGGNPAAGLSNAASGIASRLDDAAADVGDWTLDDMAGNVADEAEHLAAVAEPDYGDLEDVEAALSAVWYVDGAIGSYMARAAQIAQSTGSGGEGRARAASDAARAAASFVAGSSWREEWGNLGRVWWTLDLERNALRYDDEDVDRYIEAQEALQAAEAAQSKAWAELYVASAELGVAKYGSDTDRSRARDALEDAEQDLDDAESGLERAYDDLDHFSGLITWRDG